jgi:hypothetical protein
MELVVANRLLQSRSIVGRGHNSLSRTRTIHSIGTISKAPPVRDARSKIRSPDFIDCGKLCFPDVACLLSPCSVRYDFVQLRPVSGHLALHNNRPCCPLSARIFSSQYSAFLFFCSARDMRFFCFVCSFHCPIPGGARVVVRCCFAFDLGTYFLDFGGIDARALHPRQTKMPHRMIRQ